MLKGIPSVLSLELLKVLIEMGHGDEIVIADGNFPAASVAQRLIRSDGNGVPELLDAILRFFPLDTFVDNPVALMAVVPGDTYKPTIWEDYRRILAEAVYSARMTSSPTEAPAGRLTSSAPGYRSWHAVGLPSQVTV